MKHLYPDCTGLFQDDPAAMGYAITRSQQLNMGDCGAKCWIVPTTIIKTQTEGISYLDGVHCSIFLMVASGGPSCFFFLPLTVSPICMLTTLLTQSKFFSVNKVVPSLK